MTVLVTGGSGYIGSHTVLVLLEAGYDVVVVDNLCNSKEESLRRVERLTGHKLHFHAVDLRDEEALDAVFASYRINSVIHFAGLKAVAESVAQPLRYYDNNLVGTLVLCRVMLKHGVASIVFSSSATVYGIPEVVPIDESHPLCPINPYGQTKVMTEQILRDLYVADPTWRIALLRYFNPVGAHPSGEIGEDPNGIPNNLMPYIAQVAVGRLPHVNVYGNDYRTSDGTGVRDYIHVMDLAEAHVAALRGISGTPDVHVWNLGTGRGISVLELMTAFAKNCGKDIPYQVTSRRPGDADASYCLPDKARKELGWEARRTVDDICRDTWNWQLKNPNGY